jgi:hypothetical protein
MTSEHPTNDQIARDWDLWCDYIDPNAAMSRAEFDAMTVEQRVALIEEIFPDD